MRTLELLKQLIAIPSFVDEKNNEKNIGEFIYQYLKQFSFLTVEKQFITPERFNIIAKDKFPTKLLLNGHIDTVQPKTGWLTDQYKSVVKNGKLYGLGASDMKSNVAAMLSSITNFQETKGLMLLFYIDEEYDFLGTKEFIKIYKNKIKPKYIISGDGNDLTIGNGCRGLIEISFIAKGLSGHASRPHLGKNAILRSIKAINEFTKFIGKNYTTKELGVSTCNLAFLEGGLFRGKENNRLVIGREGNNIADIAEFVLDIRTANPKLDANKVTRLIKQFLENNGLELQESKIRHNANPWITPKEQLKTIEKYINKTMPITYKNPGDNGYSDMQLMWGAFKKTPTFTFGAGCGKTCHQVNEYVKVNELEKVTIIYKQFIQELAGGITKTL